VAKSFFLPGVSEFSRRCGIPELDSKCLADVPNWRKIRVRQQRNYTRNLGISQGEIGADFARM
jgi:hypothetical protein